MAVSREVSVEGAAGRAGAREAGAVGASEASIDIRCLIREGRGHSFAGPDGYTEFGPKVQAQQTGRTARSGDGCRNATADGESISARREFRGPPRSRLWCNLVLVEHSGDLRLLTCRLVGMNAVLGRRLVEQADGREGVLLQLLACRVLGGLGHRPQGELDRLLRGLVAQTT